MKRGNTKQENVAHLFSGFGHSTLITNHLMNDKCAEISDTQVNDYITSEMRRMIYCTPFVTI